ncbi:MAG: hypothetical protein ACTSVV_05710 [Promethearchaeota archaeon]
MSKSGFIPPENPPWHYHRFNRIWHEFFWQTRWELKTDLRVNYMQSSGADIYSYSVEMSGAYVYHSYWLTFGYYSDIDYQKDGLYYTWVKHYNRAHFETTDGLNHVIAHSWIKIKEYYNPTFNAYYEHPYGPPTYILTEYLLVSVK